MSTPTKLSPKVCKHALEAPYGTEHDADECSARGPTGLGCNLAANHDGAHCAFVEDEPVAVWVDVIPSFRLRS